MYDLARGWPLHDIAGTNIVRCMAYKKGVGGGAYIAQWSCNRVSFASGGGGSKRTIDSHHKALK